MYHGAPPAFRHPTCFMGAWRCFIDSDGMVYPGCFSLGRGNPLSVLDVGFAAAFEHIFEEKECYACYDPVCTEHNFIMNLDLRAIAGHVRASFRRPRSAVPVLF